MIAIIKVTILNSRYTEYVTVQVFFDFMSTCSYVILYKASSVERLVEKYSIDLNFSDNPGRRIYRQSPLPLYKLGLKWTKCLEQKHNFITGVRGGKTQCFNKFNHPCRLLLSSFIMV